MKICPQCGDRNNDNDLVCFSCFYDFEGRNDTPAPVVRNPQRATPVIVVSCDHLEGYRITAYCGPVFSVQVSGQMLSTGEKQDNTYYAQSNIISDLTSQANGLNANAIISLSYTSDQFRLIGYGTAVKVEKVQ